MCDNLHNPFSSSPTPVDRRQSPSIRACPTCTEAMQPGRAYVSGTPLGLLAVGLSLQHLWFEPASGERERVVKSSTFTSNVVPAFRCPKCGSVLIEPVAK